MAGNLRGMRRVLAVIAAAAIGLGGALVATAPAVAATGGAISGTVTRIDTHAAVGGVTVTACPIPSGSCTSTATFENGTYALAGVPAGTYRVSFWPTGGGLSLQYFDGALYDTATPVAISDGVTVTANAVLRLAFTTTGTAAVAGAARVGQTLTASVSGFVPAPDAIAWQWTRDGSPIPGATAASYAIVAEDLGASLQAIATASKADYDPVNVRWSVGIVYGADGSTVYGAPGYYVELPWARPGGSVWVTGLGNVGCASYRDPDTGEYSGTLFSWLEASFVHSGGSVSLPPKISGQDGKFEIVSTRAIATEFTVPAGLGAGAQLSGSLVVTCVHRNGDPADALLTTPLTIGPSVPESIPSVYHSPIEFTYYGPGAGGDAVAGQPLTMNAIGWQPGESVTVTLVNSTVAADQYFGPEERTGVLWRAAPVTAVADGAGAIAVQTTVPAGWRADDDFDLVVTGTSSRILQYTEWGDDGDGNGTTFVPLAAADSASVGGRLDVSAGGFGAGATVVVALHSSSAPAIVLGQLVAAQDGTVDGAVYLPTSDVAPGSYRLWVGAKTIRYTLMNAPIAVTALPAEAGLSLDGESGPLDGSTTVLEAMQGTEIEVAGGGYEPGEEVLLTLHSTPVPLGTAVADGDGAFEATVTIPGTAPLGVHTVWAEGSESGLVLRQGIEVEADPDAHTPSENFVLQAYRDFIGREATPQELAAGILLPRTTFIQRLATSDVWVKAIVNGFYQDTLGRAGEAGGVNFWSNQIATRQKTVASVAADFYASQEYFNNIGGGTNASWVTDLYQKLMFRTPSATEVGFWVGQIQTGAMNRLGVASFFYSSVEKRRLRVSDLYEKILNRTLPTTDSGYAYWTEWLLTHDDVDLAVVLATTGNEYFDKAQTPH